MTATLAMISGFTNLVNARMEQNLGEKSSGGTYGGLVSTNIDSADRSINYHPTLTEETSNIEYSPYAPINHTVNFTISGSDVSDTGNTQYANPTTFIPSVSQTATPTNTETESHGIDLTSIIVPVAGIAGVAALAYAAMTIFGGDEPKKKSGGKKNE